MATDVLVLPGGVHGMPISEYVTALESRLSETEIQLANTTRDIETLLPEATIVTGQHFDSEKIENAKNMKLFQVLSAGTEHLPLDAFQSHDVTVTNASGVHGPNVAEHAIGAALFLTRRFHVARRQQDRGEWRRFKAHELANSTVTVVGLGPIGQAIVERLEGFDVETIGIRYSPDKGGPTDEVIGFDLDAVEAALSRTDYLMLACPLTETTRNLIDAEALERLPPSAIIVNVARGGVIDTEALLAAIQSNDLRGAALDVTDPEPLPPDHPLWDYENVLITPHSAGHTPEYYERLADIFARNIRRIEETGSYSNLENQVVP